MQENRSAFEDQWQEAFENAEMAPSEGLWKNIDNQLTMQENGKYRKGFIFYRSLAAACVVCLFGLGYYVLQDSLEANNHTVGQQIESSSQEEKAASAPKATEENTGSPAETTQDNEQPLAEAAPEKREEDNQANSLTLEKSAETGSTTPADADGLPPGTKSTLAETSQSKGQPAAAGALAEAEESTDAEMPTIASARFSMAGPDYLAARGPDTEQEAINADWVNEIDRLYRVPQIIVDEEEDEVQGGLFAGINLATNYFDPNFSQGGSSGLFNAAADEPAEAMNLGLLNESSLAMANRYSTQASNSGVENRPQLSLSYGVDLGLMLSKHLSLESGIDYGRMNSSTSTQLVAEDFSRGERIPVLVSNAREVQGTNTTARFTPQEQQLTNSFDIISVPLKLGYNLQFHRINIVLASGVAANFFLNNRLSDESGQLNTVSVSAASDSSPFRRLFYSALISGGLNYMLTDNYAFSVTPNYNLALTDLTQSGYNFSSQPNNFGIDFGIRYVFQ